jgi:hypothetical protein
MNRSIYLMARGLSLCAVILVVSLAGCSGSGTSSIIPTTGTSSSAAATTQSAHRHTRVTVNAPLTPAPIRVLSILSPVGPAPAAMHPSETATVSSIPRRAVAAFNADCSFNVYQGSPN